MGHGDSGEKVVRVWSETEAGHRSERFHSGTSGGRVRDGNGDLILGSDSLLDNSIEEVEEDPIDRGLDEGVVVETGAARGCDDVSLNREEVFGVKMLQIFEMSLKAN